MTDESIFAAALAISDVAERAALLDRACTGQPALRREVEALLAAHAADNPLDRPLASLGLTGAFLRQDDLQAAAPGDRIGPYRLMEQIGEGGFGLVFVAEQSEPVRRKVALKVLKPGMDTRDVVARFEAERQALALMDHPHIAKVFDAGSTPAGRPYFVMELVRGVPITAYCDQNRLSPRQRLALFVQVCHAVQHAHQKGVIHRDLKPGNVLVTSHDGVPVPKVIDFGVAKAVGQSLTDKTIYTRFAQLIGTPLYMSPEQAEMSALDVDTRTDVYALGVLLYELLTGTTPFDRDRFRKAAFDEIRRILREEEPPRPSARLSTLGEAGSAVSASRGTDPVRLAGLVRGELDWIVMRCLEKDRNRRYETASGLARDVQRYLAGEAVEACPPTVGYRLRRFWREHRTALVIGFIIAVALKTSTLVSIWFASRAMNAELTASQQRDDAVAAREAVATERDKVEQANQTLRRLAAQQRRTMYALSMSLAQAAWDGGDPDRTLELLRQQVPGPGRDDLRGFEWHYWNRFAHLDKKTVRLAGFDGASRAGALARLSPDGTRAAAFATDTAGPTTALTLWDAQTGSVVWREPVATDPDGLPGLRFSADGRRLVTRRYVRGPGGRGGRNEVLVWDVATGKATYTGDFPDPVPLQHATLSGDGSRLAVCLREDRAGTPATLSVRQLPGGKEVFRRAPAATETHALGLALSPDGKRLAAVLYEGPPAARSLRLWDVESSRELVKIGAANVPTRDLVFSPDGTCLASLAALGTLHEVVLWDAAHGKKLQLGDLPSPADAFTLAHPLAFGPGGKWLAALQGAQAYLFDTARDGARHVGKPLRAFRGHQAPLQDLAFSADGERLVTLDQAGVVKHWDVSARERPLFTPFDEAALTGRPVLPNPQGSRVVVLPSWTGAGGLRIADASGRTVGEAPLEPGTEVARSFSYDGRTFAVVLGRAAGGTELSVWDTDAGKEVRRFGPGAGRYFTAVALSPDGARVAAFASRAGGSREPPFVDLTIWETATGRELISRRISGADMAITAAYSPDGHWLVFSDARLTGSRDRLVWLDAATGQEGTVLHFRKGPTGRATRFAFSRDGRRLAAHTPDGPSPVLVWEVEAILRGQAGPPIAHLAGHGGGVSHVDFSPDGRRVLTCGAGVVKLWDTASSDELLTLRDKEKKLGLALFSPDGNTIWGGLDEDGRLWGWDGTPAPEAKSP